MAHLQLNWKLKNSENNSGNQNQQLEKNNVKDKSYKLREASIKKRIEVEHRKKEPKKRGPKPRPKSQPMSKYRRKTANLRERQRMGEINTGFENLRAKIPTPAQAQNAKCEKMTKINVLHVAINYIRALESILDTGDAGIHIYGTSVVQSPNLPLSPEAEPPIEKVAKNPPKSNPNSIRRGNQNKQQNQQKTTQQQQTKTTTPTIKTEQPATPIFKTTRTKNPSSSSSSEDSGINMDSEDLDSEDIICPDWTELTSTLELFPMKMEIPLSSIQNQPKFGQNQQKFVDFKPNLDTLLSSATTMANHAQQPVLTPSLSNNLNPISKILQPKDLNFFTRQNSNPNSNSMLMQTSNSNGNMPLDLDFFGDLNSSFDSLESSNVSDMIPFHEEDPFELVF